MGGLRAYRGRLGKAWSPRHTGRSIATAKYGMNVFAQLHAPGARELVEPLLFVTTAVPRMGESRHDPPGV